MNRRKKHTEKSYGKNNKTKFTVPRINISKDTKRILEDQNNSNSNDLECVEFLNSLNFESVDKDEEYINYSINMTYHISKYS